MSSNQLMSFLVVSSRTHTAINPEQFQVSEERLDRRGGLGKTDIEVKDALWDRTKVPKFSLVVARVILNAGTVYLHDVRLFLSFTTETSHTIAVYAPDTWINEILALGELLIFVILLSCFILRLFYVAEQRCRGKTSQFHNSVWPLAALFNIIARFSLLQLLWMGNPFDLFRFASECSRDKSLMVLASLVPHWLVFAYASFQMLLLKLTSIDMKGLAKTGVFASLEKIGSQLLTQGFSGIQPILTQEPLVLFIGLVNQLLSLTSPAEVQLQQFLRQISMKPSGEEDTSKADQFMVLVYDKIWRCGELSWFQKLCISVTIDVQDLWKLARNIETVDQEQNSAPLSHGDPQPSSAVTHDESGCCLHRCLQSCRYRCCFRRHRAQSHSEFSQSSWPSDIERYQSQFNSLRF
jgi:hypothetical protein